MRASRGPRRRGRGNRPVSKLAASFSHASMGPRRRGRGNAQETLSYGLDHVLQWGHGVEAVETAQIARAAKNFGKASMGPRRRGRGNRTSVGYLNRRRVASMGPRRRGRGNEVTALELGHKGSELQWGHGVEAVETIISVAQTGTCVFSFNGATA